MWNLRIKVICKKNYLHLDEKIAELEEVVNLLNQQIKAQREIEAQQKELVTNSGGSVCCDFFSLKKI